MRIYKTRYDFENLDQSEIFPGTICTITDEVDNPTYIYQNSIWNAFVTVPQSEEANPTTFNTNSTQRTFPYILAQSGVPVGIAPNGTIATNGAITLGTALPTTYSGGIWLRFPANSVVGDSTGGIYWCVMSSTTAGTAYAGVVDTASAFTPYIGSTAGGAVTGSNSAYTQNTSEITLANVTLPANALGATGCLQYFSQVLAPSNANNKGDAIKLATTQIAGIANFINATMRVERVELRAIGSQSKQCSTSWAGVGSSVAAPLFSSVDLSANATLTQLGQVAVATDYLIVQGFNWTVYPS